MTHTEFQAHRPFSSGEEDFLRFLLQWAWWPSWLCDQERLNKLLFPVPRRLDMKFGFNRLSGFKGEDV